MSDVRGRPEATGNRPTVSNEPEADTETFYLEMASGVQELLCSERIAVLAHQK